MVHLTGCKKKKMYKDAPYLQIDSACYHYQKVQDGTPPADKNFQEFSTFNFRYIEMLRKL